MALLLGAARRLPQADAWVRQGHWSGFMGPQVSGKRLGILGLGTIGRKIAQRALGFEMEIGYHNRTPQDALPYRYFGGLEALAAWCDVLVIATPGGPQTRHLVDARILRALGERGWLVNIARGSVVDTAALAEALRTHAIAGAGLDVYESEPAAPAELIGLPNVVLTPHVAGWSPEAVQNSVDRFIANATRHFAGLPMVSPI